MATRVAVACQGGGSHTAFSAGVLSTLLADLEEHGYELVGLSGTSGGAFAATAAWYGLLAEGETPSDPIEGIWADLAADSPADRLVNEWLVGSVAARSAGFPAPQVSPYQTPASEAGKRRLRRALERHIDFDAVPRLARRDDAPALVAGAVNVSDGTFETFRGGDVSLDALLASAAVPRLYEAVEIDGDLYWDGLFSQNPPVIDLLRVPPERKPDEVWIVQINPQRRTEVPRSLEEIKDRRGELSANLSLNQELRFVEAVNEWVRAGYLPERYSYTEVERIVLDRKLSMASKLDRDPEFVADLIEGGKEAGERFLADRDGG